MNNKTYNVPNISCNHCTHTITMELSDIEGVEKVEADVNTRMVNVTFKEPATDEMIKNTLATINYPAVE